MPKRKTNEEFIKELTEKFPNFPIIPIDEYYNNNTKIRCKCLIHKDIVQTTPKRLLKGHNCCPKCLWEIKHNSRVGTNEEFLQKLKYNNIDVIPLEKYSGYNTKILFKCTCGDLWLTTPQRVLLGNHCKKCGYKNMVGEKNYFYNSNLTDEDRYNTQYRFRNPLYKNFIKQCFERDKYTCQITDKPSCGDIVVHHINGYNWDINNRTNINNGITLCDSIHKEFHKLYGKGNNTKKQFIEFVEKLFDENRISLKKYNELINRLNQIK